MSIQTETQYFKDRNTIYEQDKTRVNVMTRRLQISGVNKQYVIGVPKSIVKCLGLHEQDLMKVRLDNQNNIVLSKVNLDNE